MKKLLLSSIATLFISVCAALGGIIPLSIKCNDMNKEITALKEGYLGKSYSFKVEDHVIAIITSEVQEHTHDMYLAYCVRGDNEAFIEVPVNDTRTQLDLVYTGYKISYALDRGLFDKKVSNNGWMLAK